MKIIIIILCVLVIFIGCNDSSNKENTEQGKNEEVNEEVNEEINEEINEEAPEIAVPDTPLSVEEITPLLEKFEDKKVIVSSEYIGSYGDGNNITVRLMDSMESTVELECVFNSTDGDFLSSLPFGPITISGIVWNGKLVECEIIE